MAAPPAPPRPLVVPFTKMNGAGNDFVVLDNRFLAFSDAELAALARRVCPRRTGVGADGLLALEAPAADAPPGAHFRMRYYNADGSRATMCGNGARCLARFARRAGLEAQPLVFDTDGGRYRADVPADPEAPVRLYVPPPRDFAPTGLRDAPVPRGGVYRIWTGTEHAVVFTADCEAEDVGAVGGRIRWDGAFRPAGANVDFVQVVEAGNGGAAHLLARTFEKGVEAETLACGTGALAAALAARLAGRIRADVVEVEMPGGTLRVAFQLRAPEPPAAGQGAAGQGAAEAVTALTLEGPAVFVYEGTLEWRPEASA
ncbi:MAG: diaminopimelate epimerase [Rubricoccaceae bacterium]